MKPRIVKAFLIPLGRRKAAGSLPSVEDAKVVKMTDRPWQVDHFKKISDTDVMHVQVNAPTGSGKTKLIQFCSAHRLLKDKKLRVVFSVPQEVIAPGFQAATLEFPDGKVVDIVVPSGQNLCNDTPSKTEAFIRFLKEPPSPDINGRILLCTHATLINVVEYLRENEPELLKDLWAWIDEAHHCAINEVNEDEEGEKYDWNKLGETVLYFLDNDKKCNLHVGLTTASPFRHDRWTMIPEAYKNKFVNTSLTWDEYFSQMRYLKSFGLSFVIYDKKNYFEAISAILEDSKNPLKTLIYVPRTGTDCALGTKNETVANVAKCFGPEVRQQDVCSVLRHKNKDIKFLEMVTTGGRSEKKRFMSKRSKDNEILINKHPDLLDVIVFMNMGREGMDWEWAEQAISVGPRQSLNETLQMFGRLLRDKEGKSHVHMYMLLPGFDVAGSDKEKNLNNYTVALLRSMMLEDIMRPIETEDKTHETKSAKSTLGLPPVLPAPSALSRFTEQEYEDIVLQAKDVMLGLQATGVGYESGGMYKAYKEEMASIIESYGVDEEESKVIAKKIWTRFVKQSFSMKGIDFAEFDIKLIERQNPLEGLHSFVQYGTGARKKEVFDLLREHASSTERRRYERLGFDPNDIENHRLPILVARLGLIKKTPEIGGGKTGFEKAYEDLKRKGKILPKIEKDGTISSISYLGKKYDVTSFPESKKKLLPLKKNSE